jgi:uncharacterized surface protein with fasciclin (FAS1) repeats
MKNLILILSTVTIALCVSCNQGSNSTEPANTADQSTESGAINGAGQSGVIDNVSNPNIVQVASGSKDHSTLVTALKAADLIDALSNAGPFTVYAPTNAAFDKLPEGTLEDLLKPENKDKLKNILEYHTYVGSLKIEYLQDGQSFEQVSGGSVKISRKGDKVYINDIAEIATSIPTSNGIIHVVNEVLLPK